MENHFEQVISAIAVATQQKSSEIAEIVSKDSPQTGQGYKTCVVIKKIKTLDRAFLDTHLAAQAYVAKLDNVPGVLVDSLSNSMSAY